MLTVTTFSARDKVANEAKYIEQELKKFKLVFEGIKNDDSFSDADIGDEVSHLATIIKLSSERLEKFANILKGY